MNREVCMNDFNKARTIKHNSKENEWCFKFFLKFKQQFLP